MRKRKHPEVMTNLYLASVRIEIEKALGLLCPHLPSLAAEYLWMLLVKILEP